MKVFKLFFKMLNGRIATVIVSLIIFVVMSILMIQAFATAEESKMLVLVVNEDKGEYGALLESFLEETTDLKTSSQYGDDLRDAIFYKEVDYIVSIPSDFSEKLMSGNPTLETSDIEGGMSSVVLTQNIQNYLKILSSNAKIENGISLEELQKETMDIYNKQADVNVLKDTDTKDLAPSLQLSFSLYPIMLTAFSTIVLIIASVFSEKSKARLYAAPLKTSQLLMGILGGSIVLMSVYFGILLVILQLMGVSILASANIYYIVGMYLFTLTATSMSIMIGLLLIGKPENAAAIIGNVVSLGASFLTGIFVPLEVLPTSVTMFSRILPSYWAVYGNSLIEKNSGLLSNEILGTFGIQILYIVGFMIISVLLFRKQRQIEG